jgi:hypothetical protein
MEWENEEDRWEHGEDYFEREDESEVEVICSCCGRNFFILEYIYYSELSLCGEDEKPEFLCLDCDDMDFP